MALQYSVTLRNNQLDQLEATIGTAPKLYFRSGAKPADCAAVDSGSLLATMTLPSNFMNDAASGQKTLLGTWQVNASGAGDIGHFRIKDSTETDCHCQGTVTATGGGGDMQVQNINVASGQSITITGFTISAGNA